jgi:tRNA pseudouridine38-40 synthase
MLRNFKLTIEYDGSGYQGWQRQPNGPSIQSTIEEALKRMTCQAITLIGSGRTDAGVHALGQVANFTCDTRIEPHVFHKGLNSILPDDIVIRECDEVPAEFHSRFDAKSKLYHYHILNQSIPTAIGRHYAWWIRRPLDLAEMQAAARHLLGKHDFKAFEGAGSPRSHTIRHIMQVDLADRPDGTIRFAVEADGFLRYMVRNIVGTLVSVGRGDIDVAQFKTILLSKDRNQAAATAPPHGLFLIKVNYRRSSPFVPQTV